MPEALEGLLPAELTQLLGCSEPGGVCSCAGFGCACGPQLHGCDWCLGGEA